MRNWRIAATLSVGVLLWSGCRAAQAPAAPAPQSTARSLEAESAASEAETPERARRTWLRFQPGLALDASWITPPPSANLYPRWEQLQDQRRLGDGLGLRLTRTSSLGALWTSEDGPAGIVALRIEY